MLERVAAAGTPSASLLMDLARTAVKSRTTRGRSGTLRMRGPRAGERGGALPLRHGVRRAEPGPEAYESLKSAVELDPQNPFVNYAMGAVSIHRHEPSESLPYFEEYVRLKPEDPRGRFALGAAQFYSKLFDEARAELERAARHPKRPTGAHYFLGRIARQANDLVAARREIAGAAINGDSRTHGQNWG